MTAYNAKHQYDSDWQIPRGVWANGPPLVHLEIFSSGGLGSWFISETSQFSDNCGWSFPTLPCGLFN